MTKTYTIDTKVWLYPGMAGWHFVTLPSAEADDINDVFAHAKKGWRSLPVTVTVGQTTWKTSIFPDKKSASFLLPLKAEIRKKENIKENELVTISLTIKD